MRVKEEYLDMKITCPVSGSILWVRTLNPSVYERYSNAGYQWLFEDDVVKEDLNTKSKVVLKK